MTGTTCTDAEIEAQVSSLLAEMAEKLALWQTKMPSSEDFENDLDGLLHIVELLHYPLLDGLGLLNCDLAKSPIRRNPKFRDFARQTIDHLTPQARNAAKHVISHRAWLEALRDRQAA